MHSVCLILFHLSALLVSGQWQRLYPRFEVVGTSNLHHYQGLVSMTGADNGFLVESTDPPGSSGPSSRIHHTRNDWEHSEHVGGVGGDLAGSCCTVRPLGSYPPSTYFYMVPLAGQAGPLYSLSVVNGQVTRHDFANFPAVIEMIKTATISGCGGHIRNPCSSIRSPADQGSWRSATQSSVQC